MERALERVLFSEFKLFPKDLPPSVLKCGKLVLYNLTDFGSCGQCKKKLPLPKVVSKIWMSLASKSSRGMHDRIQVTSCSYSMI